jgi:hypothetical protein
MSLADMNRDIQARIVGLETENKRLREALEKYGQHEVLCHSLGFPGPYSRRAPTCDCGLEAALAAAKPAETKEENHG